MHSRLFALILSTLMLVAAVATSAPALPMSPDPGGAQAEEARDAQLELRDDGDWTEHYFPAGDGVTMLHADVIRPKGLDLSAATPTPVILTVSPYVSHNGATTDTDLNGEGPSNRFYDFLDRSDALDRGYTYVYVDLPGDGGSGGCNDWGGNREQDAVRAGVEWAASQPWSTGTVGPA
jgi:predicted acyl esterase